MKTGKTLKVSGFDNLKVSYGTVDFKNFKSLYLNIQSWLQPKADLESWERVVGNLRKEIKHVVNDIVNPIFFDDNYIVDLDLRTSGIVYGKKSFMNLEITLFLSQEVDFKDTILKDKLKRIAKEIYIENFKKNEYFDFTLSKKSKEETS